MPCTRSQAQQKRLCSNSLIYKYLEASVLTSYMPWSHSWSTVTGWDMQDVKWLAASKLGWASSLLAWTGLFVLDWTCLAANLDGLHPSVRCAGGNTGSGLILRRSYRKDAVMSCCNQLLPSLNPFPLIRRNSLLGQLSSCPPI